MDHLEPPSMGEIMDIVDRRRQQAHRRNQVVFAGTAVVVLAAAGLGLRSLTANDNTVAGLPDDTTTSTALSTTLDDTVSTSNGSPTDPTAGSTMPGDGQTTTTTRATTESSASTTATSTTSATSTSSSEPPSGRTDPAQLLLDFAEAWRTANWTAMAQLATPDVVTTAREAYSDGDDSNVTTENIAAILDTCFEPTSGETSCEILLIPADPGYALIYRLTYSTTGTGELTITGLQLTGDAG